MAASTSWVRVPADREEPLRTLLDVPDFAICGLTLSECSKHTHNAVGVP